MDEVDGVHSISLVGFKKLSMPRVSHLRHRTRHRTPMTHSWPWPCLSIRANCAPLVSSSGSASSTTWGRCAGRHAYARRRSLSISGYEPEAVRVVSRRRHWLRVTMWVSGIVARIQDIWLKEIRKGKVDVQVQVHRTVTECSISPTRNRDWNGKNLLRQSLRSPAGYTLRWNQSESSSTPWWRLELTWQCPS